MATTSARALSLLSMLSSGSTVAGEEIARRLGVSQRTVRRDVETLRELGYAIEPVKGAGGGYRLGPGGSLPPLVLDEEQVVAIAVALQTTSAVLRGIEETSRRALQTVRQVMPRRLRLDADAFTVTALPNQWEFPAPAPEADLVRAVGTAVRQRVLLRLDYDGTDDDSTDDAGPTSRVLEPHHLVVWAARWYLVAYEATHQHWDVLRLDRITHPELTGVPFVERDLPEGGPGALVQRTPARGDRLAPWPCTGSAVLALPAELVAQFAPGGAVVRGLDEDRCELSMGAWSWIGLAGLFITFGSPMTDVQPSELRAAFTRAGEHLSGSATSGRTQ
ncbi:helix-turn-helix transcriptional regulator [Kineococcus radiotolerans]|uniref:Helix-turn-helix type 11 domain protein n=1 Tax=Kineococcus radiotolerans (strain ATCC BAA-149 / DSM 14245 / SRS30216) TaxID=266940 RepID=A6WBB0_KINRD|nr:WYL domain-containing protein [Kineococcus radiotolerans]ABS04099.1 Helix-turn-helix type 11 domain protein [Kineococcus radiotolerans SRS30216 = ATCC BAA-149]